MPGTQVLRAYRFALDPSDAQRAALSRYAGACRWAYNYALAKKTRSHQAWADRRAAYLDAGLSEAEAKERIKADGAELTDRIKVWDHHRKSLALTVTGMPPLPAMQPPAGQEALARRLDAVRADATGTSRGRELLAEARATVNALKAEAFSAGFRTPTAIDTSALWRMERDRPREEGGSPWWTEVNVYCFTAGFDRAQVAWRYWQDSLAGRRAGRRHGYPRFKKKGHAESFALFHDVKRPIIRLEGYRRLVMPGLGSIRIHDSGKRLARLVESGQAVVQSVTVTRGGHRWYASVLAKVQQDVPVLWEHVDADGTRTPYLSRAQAGKAAENGGRVEQTGRPTARQRAGGLVGVDLGSRYLAALSSPLDPADPATDLVPHPRLLADSLAKLARAQRALSRCQPGSARWRKAAAQVARLHQQITVRRASFLHGLSKKLATGFTHVAIEDLDLTALTTSAKGPRAKSGRNVKAKARFNRHLLDAGLGGLRKKLEYKTAWYGSQLVVLDDGEPVAGTCAKCKERNPSSDPSRSRFHCPSCGAVVHRHENSTANIVDAARRQLTTVASDRGETRNARRAPVSPGARKGPRQGALKREDTG
ncbi:RNA-guided endonuclease TnpB family protein [Streptomyces sp. SP17BM10]|uniref:RNA-guided endonuclease TnpB family protein n=1 Tax=Streptomyces sp. SP17BM10 TaxID=3002530 RepID=UPI002E77119E|nr:RNA-guided endonuclease TnpB family protein [Streptomyces sp. SP17BM10]MEE1782126.1 RNA-guided endonuclease TnpB family protein [Streptomyces sp. SP17BM10]